MKRSKGSTRDIVELWYLIMAAAWIFLAHFTHFIPAVCWVTSTASINQDGSILIYVSVLKSGFPMGCRRKGWGKRHLWIFGDTRSRNLESYRKQPLSVGKATAAFWSFLSDEKPNDTLVIRQTPASVRRWEARGWLWVAACRETDSFRGLVSQEWWLRKGSDQRREEGPGGRKALCEVLQSQDFQERSYVQLLWIWKEELEGFNAETWEGSVIDLIKL